MKQLPISDSGRDQPGGRRLVLRRWLFSARSAHGLRQCLQIIVERNNDISRACSRLLGIKSPSFMNLNQMISDHLASVLLPASQHQGGSPHDTVISSIVEVCPPNTCCCRKRCMRASLFKPAATAFHSHELPTRPSSGRPSEQLQQRLYRRMQQLCAHPAYRLLNIKSIPQMAGNSIQYSS